MDAMETRTRRVCVCVCVCKQQLGLKPAKKRLHQCVLLERSTSLLTTENVKHISAALNESVSE